MIGTEQHRLDHHDERRIMFAEQRLMLCNVLI